MISTSRSAFFSKLSSPLFLKFEAGTALTLKNSSIALFDPCSCARTDMGNLSKTLSDSKLVVHPVLIRNLAMKAVPWMGKWFNSNQSINLSNNLHGRDVEQGHGLL